MTAKAETPDEFMRRLEQEFSSFSQEVNNRYDSFRDKTNAQYAEALAAPWKLVKRQDPIKRPSDPKPIPEVVPVYPVDPIVNDGESSPIVVINDEVDIPVAAPQPVPYQPIPPTIPESYSEKIVNVPFYGSIIKVEGVPSDSFRLKDIRNEGFAAGWKLLSGRQWNNLINNCLKIREDYQLTDWAYVQFLMNLGATLTYANSNEQSLIAGFLLNQSGYNVRFGTTNDGRLQLLLHMNGIVYDRYGFTLNGLKYYPYNPIRESLAVCDFSSPNEKPVSIALDRLPILNYKASKPREIIVHGFPQVKLKLTVNQNLIDFYQDYPDGTINEDINTRWAFRANTPASPEFKNQIYPLLKEKLSGLNQWDGINFLLKVAQSFPYGYDSEIWGDDRIFWPDESWYYPYSDCEDHALHFTRLVRDLMGQDCCLISYPNHLSTCVAVSDGSASGDYLEYKGKRYYVCDPTYFYAQAGKTAPSNKNQPATLIPIR